MSERYWDAGEVPDALLDWVNENVVAAIKHCWEEEKPDAWAETENGRMVLIVGGPEKPMDATNSGAPDIYTATFDLLKALKEYSAPYEYIGGPCSDEQREDMRERAALLRKLSEDVAALADQAGCSMPPSSST